MPRADAGPPETSPPVSTANHVLPEADKIIFVMAILNTHTEDSLYEAFPPEKARELCERFEFHHTPKHASWLNMAETRDRAAWTGGLARSRNSAARSKPTSNGKTRIPADQLAVHQ